jgi:hypothetical protein
MSSQHSNHVSPCKVGLMQPAEWEGEPGGYNLYFTFTPNCTQYIIYCTAAYVVVVHALNPALKGATSLRSSLCSRTQRLI